jgi:SET domain-containing protein
MLHHGLYINATGHKGRAVFTSAMLKAETVIEISPVIVMSGEERKLLDQTLLHDYIFEWGPGNNQCCMALGLVPMYNHSYTSNCEYFMDFDDQTILIKTVKDVLPGEELTINYNGDWNDARQIWFDVK